MTSVSRFWSKTKFDGHCIVWTGAKNQPSSRKIRYGKFNEGGKQWQAHRWIYTQTIGKIPRHKVLLHSCDKPLCVTLQHLTPGSHAQNTEDMLSKGRGRGHFPRQHTDAVVSEARRLAKSVGVNEAARALKLTPSFVSRVVNNKRRTR